MDHSIIPLEWKNFLATLQTLFPSAIIAGGALRDTIIGNPIKDVDIFITDLDPSFNLDTEQLQKIAGLFNIKVHQDFGEECTRDHLKLTNDIKVTKRESNCASGHVDPVDNSYINNEGGTGSYLETFINYIVDVRFNGNEYQLIFVESNTISYVYNDFDFGICKVYYDGKALVVTEEFWYDMENKQLTISGKFASGQMLHTLFIHRPNLLKKFPGWKVVIDDLAKRDYSSMPPSYQLTFAPKEKLVQPPVTTFYVWVDKDGVERRRAKANSNEELFMEYGTNFFNTNQKYVDLMSPFKSPIDKDLYKNTRIKLTDPWKYDPYNAHNELAEESNDPQIDAMVKLFGAGMVSTSEVTESVLGQSKIDLWNDVANQTLLRSKLRWPVEEETKNPFETINFN